MSWRFGSDDFPFRLGDLLIPLWPRLEALAQSAKVRVPGSHVAFLWDEWYLLPTKPLNNQPIFAGKYIQSSHGLYGFAKALKRSDGIY